MADNNQKKGGGPGAAPPWERFGAFLGGKSEAILWKLFAIGFLLFALFAALFIAPGAYLMMDEDGLPISAWALIVATVFFFIFRWLWIHAVGILDDEIYETKFSESPGPKRDEPRPTSTVQIPVGENPPTLSANVRPSDDEDNGKVIDGEFTPVDGAKEEKI